MGRDLNGIHTLSLKPNRVLWIKHTLDHEIAFPGIPQPLEVRPVRLGPAFGSVKRKLFSIEVRQLRLAPIERTQRPVRMAGKIDELAGSNAKRCLEPVANFACAAAQNGHVHGQDQRLVPGLFSPLDQLKGARPVAAEIKLEPSVAICRFNDLLHRSRRDG